MGSGPQSQDVEHQPPPVEDDLRMRRESVRESSFGQSRHSPRQKSHPTQVEGETTARQSRT
jgi:hypothetical protein